MDFHIKSAKHAFQEKRFIYNSLQKKELLSSEQADLENFLFDFDDRKKLNSKGIQFVI